MPGPSRARLVAVVAVLSAIGFAPTGTVAAAAADASAGGPVPETLSVMTFNIEYGGTVVDLDSILTAVRRADADVVAFNESYGKVARLGRLTGYDHVSRRLDLISRYPFVEGPGSSGRYVFVELAPGRVVAVTNVHLASSDYGPRRILDGWSRRRVLRIERATRVPDLRPFLRATSDLDDTGIPVIVVGDMNSPSHEDWTEATVGLRPQVRFPLAWPVTRLLARRGFVDAWRAVFPDPVADQGLTWPAERPRSDTSWNPRRDAPRDRIDQIWTSGDAVAIAGALVGERGGPGVDVAVHPWGSDHRAVVSTFAINPGVPPVMVSPSPSLVERGRALDVTYHAPGDAGERVRLVPRGADPIVDAVDSMGTPPGAATDGTLSFATDALAPGPYDVVLLGGDDSELARSPWWLREPGAPPVLDAPWAVDAGVPVEISFTQAPGNRFDWIGIYPRGGDPAVDAYLDYRYAGAVVEGSVTFDDLPPGRYTAFYLLTDLYRPVAAVDLLVRG